MSATRQTAVKLSSKRMSGVILTVEIRLRVASSTEVLVVLDLRKLHDEAIGLLARERAKVRAIVLCAFSDSIDNTTC